MAFAARLWAVCDGVAERESDGDDGDSVDVFDADVHAESLLATRCARSLSEARERTPVRDATMRDNDV